MAVVDASRLGERSAPRLYRITAEAVAEFAAALGWPRDSFEAAAEVPPTFAVSLTPHPIPGLQLPPAGVIHGEQRFEYGEPLRVGDTVSVTAWVAEAKTRRSSRGSTTFVTVVNEVRKPDQRLAVRAQAVLVVNEGGEEATAP